MHGQNADAAFVAEVKTLRNLAVSNRLPGDVQMCELLELVIHAGELALDVLLRFRHAVPDPGDVEKDATVRRAAARLKILLRTRLASQGLHPEYDDEAHFMQFLAVASLSLFTAMTAIGLNARRISPMQPVATDIDSMGETSAVRLFPAGAFPHWCAADYAESDIPKTRQITV